jgi:hypothetical protein
MFRISKAPGIYPPPIPSVVRYRLNLLGVEMVGKNGHPGLQGVIIRGVLTAAPPMLYRGNPVHPYVPTRLPLGKVMMESGPKDPSVLMRAPCKTGLETKVVITCGPDFPGLPSCALNLREAVLRDFDLALQRWEVRPTNRGMSRDGCAVYNVAIEYDNLGLQAFTEFNKGPVHQGWFTRPVVGVSPD